MQELVLRLSTAGLTAVVDRMPPTLVSLGHRHQAHTDLRAHLAESCTRMNHNVRLEADARVLTHV